MKPGPCTENTPAWYYDPKDGTCAAFSYGGCEGNANRYESEEQCLRQCGSFKNQDVCSFEKDWGPCVGRFRKFFYNTQLKACEEFTFGGCGGNGNRFSSLEECENICLIREEPEISADESSISKDAICKLEIDTGLDSCTDNLRRWHYDSKLGSCTAFIYSGCAGNRNRFKNFETCMGFCEGPPTPGAGASSFTPPPRRPGAPIPPVGDLFGQDDDDDGHPPYEEPDTAADCSASEARCDRARCKYGTERYYDDRTRCEECYCSEPCHGFECPSGTTCQVEPYKARGETVYKAVCKDDTKAGICPKVNRNQYSTASCVEECSSDGDCSGEQKCCYNGCGNFPQPTGKSCMKATPAEVPDYDDNSVAPVNPNAPIVEVVETPVIVPEGDIATLRIRVSGNPTPDVYWRKGRQTVPTGEGKFRIVDGGSLQIVGVAREDEGRYDAFADNGLGAPVTQYVVLSVDSPRDLPARIVDTDADVTMSLGSPAKLYCLAYGFPKPTVTWWKGTTMLPLSSERHRQEEFTLSLRSVALPDLGPYTCQAYNGGGSPASHSVRMQVYGPVYPAPGEQKFMRYVVARPNAPRRPAASPRPSGYRPTRPQGWDYSAPVTAAPQRPRMREISVRIGMSQTKYQPDSRILIPCQVNSGLRPTVKWLKEGQKVRESSRLKIQRNNNTLSINQAQAQDSGSYTCSASNGYNEAQDSVIISVEQIQVEEKCQDNPYFANCKLIVKARYCGNKYYARFCCRSCTLAGQL